MQASSFLAGVSPHMPSDAGGPLIQFRDVGLVLGGRTLLDSITLDIREGEFVCVVGPSGCGKTTMSRLAAGLLRATAGQVLFDSKPLAGPRLDVAVVFQDYGKALLPWRTAAQNVALALEALGVPAREHGPRIMDLLHKMGLSQHADKYPSQLSGGMQQRLQIARCLAQQPRVLIMDEPFGALDAMTRQVLQDELLSLVAGTRATVVFVTHDLEEAIYLGDRVVALRPNPGRIDQIFEIDVPKPRDQVLTKEQPEFLRMRHVLYDFFKAAQA